MQAPVRIASSLIETVLGYPVAGDSSPVATLFVKVVSKEFSELEPNVGAAVAIAVPIVTELMRFGQPTKLGAVSLTLAHSP